MAMDTMLSDHGNLRVENNWLKLSELSKICSKPSTLLDYEKLLLTWAEILLSLNSSERAILPLAALDCKTVYSNELMCLYGDIALHKKQYEKAHSCFQEVVLSCPEDYVAATKLASIFFKDPNLVSVEEAETYLSNSMYEPITQVLLRNRRKSVLAG